MPHTQTLNDYVVYKFKLARGLKENRMPVTNSRLLLGIVKGLPREFEHQKANLYTSLKERDQGEVVHTLMTTARLLGYDDSGKKIPFAHALPNVTLGTWEGEGEGEEGCSQGH